MSEQLKLVCNDKGNTRSIAPRSAAKSLAEILEIRIGRRDFTGAALAAALVPAALAGCGTKSRDAAEAGGFGFEEVPMSPSAEDLLPPGYSRQLLVSWGDPIYGGAPGFDAARQTREVAERQFGYNNDFIAYLPLGDPGRASEHGLLVVNHEYPLPWLMWDDLDESTAAAEMSRKQVDVSMAAVGLSVIEVRRQNAQWKVVTDSKYNRRVSMFTPIDIRGPARGHERMRTTDDPAGTTVLGTHDNCSGGVTPWGTVLSCEEGSADFFAGDHRQSGDREHLQRYYYDVPSNGGEYGWGRYHSRLNFNKQINEPNRFEWVVEIDPYDPGAAPVKRTALGRFAHEGAHVRLNRDGRVVVFMGDDWEFEYVYRFVSDATYDAANREANRHLLDEGTLSVARFDDDGSLTWMPIRFGEGPLTPANGFEDQGDVMIQTRRAADLLGATPMDAPEGFVSDPQSGVLYLALTQNRDRGADQLSAANPRANNEFGHLLRLNAPGDDSPDFATQRFAWSVMLLCGEDGPGSGFHSETRPDSRFTDPDNLAVDGAGRLWVCTDAGNGERDALYVVETRGSWKNLSRRFYLPPLESECCSPTFTPDGRTMFLSVQHPGEEAANVDSSVTRWPARKAGEPPRPSVIAIRRDDDGIIGT